MTSEPPYNKRPGAYEGRVVEDAVSERSVRILNECLAMLYAQMDEKDQEIQRLITRERKMVIGTVLFVAGVILLFILFGTEVN